MITLNGNYQRRWMVIILTLMLLSQFIVSAEIHKEPVAKTNGSVIPSLHLVREKLKNVEFYRDALDTIIEMYGEPSRYLGSMDPTPQWDIEGGFLTCSYLLGVIYSPKSNFSIFDEDTVFLIDTANRVDENLRGNYHLLSLPRDNSRRLGNLELKADGQYHFDIATKDLGDKFFLNHSDGSFTIEYQPDIKPTDLLENMKHGTILAKINFRAKDNGDLYFLYFSIEGRAIVTKPANGYEFIGYWKNPYYKLTGQRNLPPFSLFKEQIKNAGSSTEAYKIIRKVYGEAHRTIEDTKVWPKYLWDVEGGVLAYNFHTGVSYEKLGRKIYLIDTQNKVGKTVIGYYSMYALASDNTDKITRFLGSILTLETNGQYKLETRAPYKHSKKEDQSDRFFSRYPSGTYIFKYQKGIKPDELLENLKDGTVLGKIDFASGTNRESFYICIKERSLIFKPIDGKSRTYTLLKYWNNYHRSER